MPLIQIAKFNDHQTPHVREAAATLPAPLHSLGDASPSPRSPVYGNGSSSVTGNESDSSEPLPRSKPAMMFPIVGKGGHTWGLTPELVAKWDGLYPNLSVVSEMRKALAWLDANPGRRKTDRGMPAFLVNWLSRATDSRAGDRRSEARGSADRRAVSHESGWPEGGCPHTPEYKHYTPCNQRIFLDAERAKGKAS